ncbi:jg3519 [Pararge aegeria aegeria]|uniref:Jg3519 protein n=1 Tax=Pararge aegeria aegeria TaxID=348720 RepID=A0A8S4QTD3_9NEOP|nr:jg3519 [Pararge aegeria aegeria]
MLSKLDTKTGSMSAQDLCRRTRDPRFLMSSGRGVLFKVTVARTYRATVTFILYEGRCLTEDSLRVDVSLSRMSRRSMAFLVTFTLALPPGEAVITLQHG